MANTILTPDIIAREALMVLRNNAVMANLVHRDYSNEFVAGVGDTITIRKPATFTAKEFSGTISVQDATENSVTVKMDKFLDVSFAVTAKELTMDIADFSTQFIVPAMQAFADKVDGYLLGLASDVTNKVTATADIKNDVIDARAYLTKSATPLTERRFVYNTDDQLDCTYQEQGLLACRYPGAASAGADGGRPVRLYAGLGRGRRQASGRGERRVCPAGDPGHRERPHHRRYLRQ